MSFQRLSIISLPIPYISFYAFNSIVTSISCSKKIMVLPVGLFASLNCFMNYFFAFLTSWFVFNKCNLDGVIAPWLCSSMNFLIIHILLVRFRANHMIALQFVLIEIVLLISFVLLCVWPSFAHTKLFLISSRLIESFIELLWVSKPPTFPHSS